MRLIAKFKRIKIHLYNVNRFLSPILLHIFMFLELQPVSDSVTSLVRIQLPLPVNVLVKRGRFLFAFILALSLIERLFIMEFIKKVSESRLFTLKSFDRLVYNLTYRVLRIYNFNKYKHKIILRSIKRGSRNFTALFV